MNCPRPICAGCEKPMNVWGKPICDDCLRATGEVPRPYCPLCEVGLLVNQHGIHTTKTGGYAGICAAQHGAGPDG